MNEEQYKKYFCGETDVSRAELLRRAITNAKKRNGKLTGYRKLNRRLWESKFQKKYPDSEMYYKIQMDKIISQIQDLI